MKNTQQLIDAISNAEKEFQALSTTFGIFIPANFFRDANEVFNIDIPNKGKRLFKILNLIRNDQHFLEEVSSTKSFIEVLEQDKELIDNLFEEISDSPLGQLIILSLKQIESSCQLINSYLLLAQVNSKQGKM